MKIGDKVFQTKYDWGKHPNGQFKTYIVQKISEDNHQLGGGKSISCLEIETSKYIHYIPQNTWKKVEEFRNTKIEELLESSITDHSKQF